MIELENSGFNIITKIVLNKKVNLRPQNISRTEASSVLYAGLTAWSALWITGGLCYKTTIPMINRRVLVLGGSGGVGTLAIQLLKAWNAQVFNFFLPFKFFQQ